MAYFYNDRQVRQAIRSRSGCFTIHQEAGRAVLRFIRKRAVLTAVLPPKSLILYTSPCWSDAKWDAVPSKYAAQIWKFEQQENCKGLFGCNSLVSGISKRIYPWSCKTDWATGYLVDTIFIHCEGCPSCALECYRTRQQDACQYVHADLQGEQLELASLLLKNPGQMLSLSSPPL